MNPSELIEKRYELLKEKAELNIELRTHKSIMKNIEFAAIASGAIGGTNPELRKANMYTYLLRNELYQEHEGKHDAIINQLDRLQPEIAYIEDLIELAKLEMKNV